jgi:prepilin-type processing-associated H-X9-DG protein
LHPGGAQVAMCDGSARLLNENIVSNPAACPPPSTSTNGSADVGVGMVWQNLYVRNDGYTIGAGTF